MFSSFILPDIPWPAFWLLVALAVLIQGISKSGFAGGAGILSLPLMMLVMPVDKVAATLLPLMILCDFAAIYHHRDNKVWRSILQIYLPSLLGILAGAAVWWWVGREGVTHYARPLNVFTGVIAILFACYLAAKEASMQWILRHRPGTPAGIVFGIAAGFTSTLIHAAGPIVALYVFAQDLGKSLFVGTVAWTFTLINLTKLPFYFATGLIHTDVLLFDLMLVPLIPLGSWIGHWMHTRINERHFQRVIMVLTLLSGLQLVSGVNLVQLGLKGVAGLL
jgi:uncharacterized membrane protein YfcA